MKYTDKYLKERIPAVKITFKTDAAPIESECEIEFTDYVHGIIELKIGYVYYHIRHVDLERAITSMQVRREADQ